MKQDRASPSRGGATLGDALSSSVKEQLHRLRDTLEKRAREAIGTQLAQPRPPWHGKEKRVAIRAGGPKRTVFFVRGNARKSGLSPKKPVRANGPETGRKQPTQPRATIRERLYAPRTPAPAPAPRPAHRPFEYWAFPGEAPVREAPPVSIAEADRLRLEDLFRAGTQPSASDGEPLFVVLGLDFGTSSTKLIVRLPTEPGAPTIAIPAPHHCRSGDVPYLWQTVLWLLQDGTFRPWPESGARVLHSLKQGLMQGRADTPVPMSDGGPTVTRAQSAVAYLSFVIRYARGWLIQNRSEFFRGRTPAWFVNIGMAAESYDDVELGKAYRRVGAAALQLAKLDSPITVEAAKVFLTDPHVVAAGQSKEMAEDLGIAIFPEAAAEMTGFAKSTRNAPGLYLLADVGAMTFDVCMFRLQRDPGAKDLYSFMAARVRPLGADAFHWFQKEGKTEPEFLGQCEYALKEVVWHTKLHRDPTATNWRPGEDVPVFLAGGGATNPIHRQALASLGPWLKRFARNNGVRLLELPVPRAIELPEPLEAFGRMAVAWGLSFPPDEIGHIRPMREIEDIPRLAVAQHGNRFISKDDV